ncbi:hypothetical protein CALVIDRAFT_595126 [Calocera viscosa TUFC12733]|uniref:Secreted protein n=1 Tax=Calocera viscosa (strain TUFC12733) TaxID=1330018 RepID=A0A167RK00_CALVF|nr:hypothetical protein CALVIDRAFT_595126 [Calocera viscosa TUFC12733]
MMSKTLSLLVLGTTFSTAVLACTCPPPPLSDIATTENSLNGDQLICGYEWIDSRKRQSSTWNCYYNYEDGAFEYINNPGGTCSDEASC